MLWKSKDFWAFVVPLLAFWLAALVLGLQIGGDVGALIIVLDTALNIGASAGFGLLRYRLNERHSPAKPTGGGFFQFSKAPPAGAPVSFLVTYPPTGAVSIRVGGEAWKGVFVPADSEQGREAQRQNTANHRDHIRYLGEDADLILFKQGYPMPGMDTWLGSGIEPGGGVIMRAKSPLYSGVMGVGALDIQPPAMKKFDGVNRDRKGNPINGEADVRH